MELYLHSIYILMSWTGVTLPFNMILRNSRMKDVTYQAVSLLVVY